jgi:hypothetical protein
MSAESSLVRAASTSAYIEHRAPHGGRRASHPESGSAAPNLPTYPEGQLSWMIPFRVSKDSSQSASIDLSRRTSAVSLRATCPEGHAIRVSGLMSRGDIHPRPRSACPEGQLTRPYPLAAGRGRAAAARRWPATAAGRPRGPIDRPDQRAHARIDDTRFGLHGRLVREREDCYVIDLGRRATAPARGRRDTP